ncbi:MAG: hypothetical protein AB9915_02090 [Candidatus Dojkabacteria bacterium]
MSENNRETCEGNGTNNFPEEFMHSKGPFIVHFIEFLGFNFEEIFIEGGIGGNVVTALGKREDGTTIKINIEKSSEDDLLSEKARIEGTDTLAEISSK